MWGPHIWEVFFALFSPGGNFSPFYPSRNSFPPKFLLPRGPFNIPLARDTIPGFKFPGPKPPLAGNFPPFGKGGLNWFTRKWPGKKNCAGPLEGEALLVSVPFLGGVLSLPKPWGIPKKRRLLKVGIL